MKIPVPELSVVVLIGPSGSGKSSFARMHFKPTEILSSDFCRGLVSDDENSQAATKDAFEVLHFIAAKRLAAGKLVVIDATNVQPEARKPLVELARAYHCLPVAIVLDVPERICQARNRERPDRDFGPHVVRNQCQQLHRSFRGLQREGFRYVYTLKSEEEVNASIIERQPLWNNRREEHGPFDIVGDVHGCLEELLTLLEKLGYQVQRSDEAGGAVTVLPPDGRKAVFLGDLVDRGPDVAGVLALTMQMVETGSALCIPGNHDMKLLRKLNGRDVQITHGLEQSLEQLAVQPPEFRERVIKFLDSLVSHYVLDDGRLVVAHAGLKQEMQGRGSRAVREFALYGETTGETDEFGLPIRYNWAAEYRGPAMVVYGHTPVPVPEWLNRTINIDTGCVFGGRLTALRYPEEELVSVPAAHIYSEPVKPFLAPEEAAAPRSIQQQYDDVLDIEDVIGKRIIQTRLQRNVTIREGNAMAALEVMSRYAANPRWLIYLPPTMSPSETSQEPGLLEHPTEAFSYFRHQGIPQVVCEEKHMGSRCVVIVCRDEAVALRAFGVADEGIGICYTRTGRRFFDDPLVETGLLSYVRQALDNAGAWEELATDWICLDCELMPWSAKAQELIRHQYAAVGAASQAALTPAVEALKQAADRAGGDADVLKHYQARHIMAEQFVEAYRHYCWPVNSLQDIRLAPFHILSTEGAVHTNKNHLWHIETLSRICGSASSLSTEAPPTSGGPPGSPLFTTAYRTIDLNDTASVEAGIAWWEDLTARGGEGMVVKPLDFVAHGSRGLVQPAVKCRGKEYLRIIYGPEYTAPENLERLRSRSLGAKRSLALREFALGIEGLERLARREPLRRIHECVFGVLALESEPVDPRL